MLWRYWEQLPPPGDQAGGALPRQPVAPVDGDGDTRVGRFDDAPLKDDPGPQATAAHHRTADQRA